jgi:hypothetical protein
MDVRDYIAQINGSTFNNASIGVNAQGTHVSIKLQTADGYTGSAKLGSLAVHLKMDKDD